MTTKKTAYSILELALVSKDQSYQQTFNNVLKLAQHAESFGYKRFWLAEHHNSVNIGSSATSVLMTYVAAGTQTIRVGSGGVMLPNHSPLIIAEQFATLAALYPDRIDLGLDRAPGTDRETMLAIRSDFMNAALSFPYEIAKIERYFSTDNATSGVRVPMAEGVDVPLYILGSSTDSAHLAAQKGLPYAFASHFAPAQLSDALTIYHREFEPSKNLKKPYVMTGVNIIVADTDEQAERLATSLIRMVLGIFTGQRDYVQPPTEMTDELREILENPQIKQMLKYSFIGSQATVKAQVKAFMEETRADELIAVTHLYDVDDRIRSYQLFADIMQELNSN